MTNSETKDFGPAMKTGDFVVFSLAFQISVPEVERIDTGAIYHKLTIGQLQEEVPQIDWLEYFSVLLHPLPINTSEQVVSYSTPYFLQLGELLAQTDKK